MKRILILEPYYGGSHQHFLEGLQANILVDYLLLSLPARKWKMRMQISAVWFVEQIEQLATSDRHFDVVLCSTFVDVAVLQALLRRVTGWNHETRIVTYFHENQFAYPDQFKNLAAHQFTSINFHSALCSDSIAFNSSFNRESFFSGCAKILKVSSDMKFPGVMQKLKDKSHILFPGIDFSAIDQQDRKAKTDIPVIVWNHRWEHDKNPESFFNALGELQKRGVEFRLIILGQSFNNSPPCFQEGQERFKDKILHFGFADSYLQYARLLCQGDIVISTSLHEFYGISVIEAVRAGCRPLLPNRLSYPELFDKEFLYNDDASLAKKLETLILGIARGHRLAPEQARKITERFSWSRLQQPYTEWLLGHDVN